MAKNGDSAGKIDEKRPVDDDDQVAPTVINEATSKNGRFSKFCRNERQIVDSLEKLISKSTLEKLPLRRRPVAASAAQPNGTAMQVVNGSWGKPPLPPPRWRVARPAGPPGTTVLRITSNKTINVRSSPAHGSSAERAAARSMLPPRPRPPPRRQMDQSPWLPSPVPVPIFKRRPLVKFYSPPNAAAVKKAVVEEKGCDKDLTEGVAESSAVVEISSKKAKLET